MALWQGKARRCKTGRRIRYARSKRRFEVGGEQTLTMIGENTTKTVRTRGKHQKTKIKTANTAYVLDKKTNKTEIITVLDNPANPHYIRRNIMNKGAIINTKLGKARITSRPGQTGAINAVLIE
jgi:small subunit ribosomal protein S8e